VLHEGVAVQGLAFQRPEIIISKAPGKRSRCSDFFMSGEVSLGLGSKTIWYKA